jgi:hypothetical protein
MPAIKNFTLGVLVGGALIFNMIISQFNIDSISESYKNLAKLQGTTLTNKVGINSILGYSEENRLELTFDKSKYDAYVKWRGGVRKNQEQWRPLYIFFGGAILLLLISSTRKMDVVGSYVSSLSLMILIDPMNYYYVVFPFLLLTVRGRSRNLGIVFLPSILVLIYLMMNPVVISSVVHQDVKFMLESYQVSIVVLTILLIVMFMNEENNSPAETT